MSENLHNAEDTLATELKALPRCPAKPLAEYNQTDSARNYSAFCTPTKPDIYDDYLRPTLASNEPLRLKTLWYYLHGIHEDATAMQRIRDVVALVKELLGWEYAICGIVECDHFERIACEGVPTAIIPREESPCSHTVLQPAGTVLFLPDMTQDWRFQHSPCVGKMGLAAYAGVPLQVPVQDGLEEVAIGSLCVASATAQQLSEAQLKLLTKLAVMLSADITSSAKFRRMQQQERNDGLLRKLIESGTSLTESMVLAAIEATFPGVQHLLIPYTNGHLELVPAGTIPPHVGVQCRLWEDNDYIQEYVRLQNHQRSRLATRPIRAIVADIPHDSASRALVLITPDISIIFDDIDMRFVSSCALLLSNITRDKELRNALGAKERFMRGITHHLRTPIHGILASIELMQSDIDTTLMTPESWRRTSNSIQAGVGMVRDSGQELMQFVNSIIKYNHWFEPLAEQKALSIVDADTIEAQILQDIPSPLVMLRVRNTCVYFSRKIPDNVALVLQDDRLILDCVQPILVNAMQNTSKGSISITYAASPDYSSIVFDIADTGHGIAEAEHQRIFDSYQKAESGRQGSGLGLTLARRLAGRYGGSVSLVGSQPGHGAHFRIVLNEQSFACPWSPVSRRPAAPFNSLPKRFSIIDSGSLSGHVICFTQLLQEQCSVLTTIPDDALAIVPYTHDADEYELLLGKTAGARLACSLIPNQADVSVMQTKYPEVIFYRCPFTTARLYEIMLDINRRCEVQTPEPGSCTTEHAADTMLNTSTICDNGLLVKDPPRFMDPPQCLLVDDNVINLRILCMFCKQRNYPYREAIDGHEAVQQYKDAYEIAPVGLILLDLQMPRCDGIEACKAIRQFEASRSTHRAVVIMITGQDNPVDRRSAVDAGADDYFVKPLALKKLNEVIRTHFPRLTG